MQGHMNVKMRSTLFSTYVFVPSMIEPITKKKRAI